MRRAFFWILLVLGLPQVAGAAAAIGVAAEPMVAGGAAALERAARGTSPAGLDLRLDAGLLRFAQDPPDGASASDAGWAEDDPAIYEPDPDRGLSFGFEIKPRSRIGALARQDETEDPSLGDQLQKLIENPVLGVRGRYRF
jgi:hypothetical protein